MNPEKQLEFPYPKMIERQEWIDQVNFREVAKHPAMAKYRKKASGRALKKVLDRIGRYPENFEGQRKMARELEMTKEHLGVVIRALIALDLVTLVRRRGDQDFGRVGSPNHHRVNWEQVRRLIGYRAPTDQRPRQEFPTTNTRISDDQDKNLQRPTQEFPTTKTRISASLYTESITNRDREESITTSPPNPPPIEASEVDQCEEEEGDSSRLISIPFALIRTEKPTAEPTHYHAIAAELQDEALAARPTAAELQAEQDPEAVLARSADALAARSTEADLVRRYRQANVYDADQLIERLLPEVGTEYLDALLAFWLTNQTSFEGAGALRLRLKRSRPDLPIADGWPPLRHKPPIPKVKCADEQAAEREAYLRARAEAQLVASVEPSMGEQLRARRAAMITGNSVDPEGLRVCTQAPAVPQWSGPTESCDRGRAAEACP